MLLRTADARDSRVAKDLGHLGLRAADQRHHLRRGAETARRQRPGLRLPRSVPGRPRRAAASAGSVAASSVAASARCGARLRPPHPGRPRTDRFRPFLIWRRSERRPLLGVRLLGLLFVGLGFSGWLFAAGASAAASGPSTARTPGFGSNSPNGAATIAHSLISASAAGRGIGGRFAGLRSSCAPASSASRSSPRPRFPCGRGGRSRGCRARLARHRRQPLDHVGADRVVAQRQVADRAIEVALGALAAGPSRCGPRSAAAGCCRGCGRSSKVRRAAGSAPASACSGSRANRRRPARRAWPAPCGPPRRARPSVARPAGAAGRRDSRKAGRRCRAHRAGTAPGLARIHQFGQAEANARLDPGGGALAHILARRPVEQVRRQRLDLGRQQSPLGNRRATGPPPQQTRSCESNTISPSGATSEGLQARRQVLRKARSAALSTAFWSVVAFGRVGNKPEALDASEMLALDNDLARFGDRRRHFALIAQSSYQQRRPPIDKALGQTLVQRVRQAVLDRARAFLPMRGALIQSARCEM